MDQLDLALKPEQESAIELCLAECTASLTRLSTTVGAEKGGRVDQIVTAAAAMATGQALTRLLEDARVPWQARRELVPFFADNLRDKLTAYVDSPLFAYHRGRGVPATVTPDGVQERQVYRVEGGWAFEPRSHGGPTDGWVFVPGKPKKGRHEAFCLGGVVICRAWKGGPRRVLGPLPRE